MRAVRKSMNVSGSEDPRRQTRRHAEVHQADERRTALVACAEAAVAVSDAVACLDVLIGCADQLSVDLVRPFFGWFCGPLPRADALTHVEFQIEDHFRRRLP